MSNNDLKKENINKNSDFYSLRDQRFTFITTLFTYIYNWASKYEARFGFVAQISTRRRKLEVVARRTLSLSILLVQSFTISFRIAMDSDFLSLIAASISPHIQKYQGGSGLGYEQAEDVTYSCGRIHEHKTTFRT